LFGPGAGSHDRHPNFACVWHFDIIYYLDRRRLKLAMNIEITFSPMLADAPIPPLLVLLLLLAALAKFFQHQFAMPPSGWRRRRGDFSASLFIHPADAPGGTRAVVP
jgi:hypothetical protein